MTEVTLDEMVAGAMVLLVSIAVALLGVMPQAISGFLIFAGLLALRALAGPYLAVPLVRRVDAFVLIGLIIFAAFSIDRVFNAVGI